VNASPPADIRIRQLIDASERSFAAGRAAEADTYLEQARREAPGHPLVLNQTGLRELRRERTTDAKELFERAIAGDRRNPSFWINLATAHGALGNDSEEMRALEEALKIEPRHLLALLQKGALLARTGKTRHAASVYHDALLSIPPGRRLPKFLEPFIEDAQAAVKANLAALESFLDAKLADARTGLDEQAQERFNHCIDVALGKKRVYTVQPAFLHFPKLPALEFYPRELFPWLGALEDATAAIREEFLAVHEQEMQDFVPYLNHGEHLPLGKLAPLNKSPRWSVFYLWREGRPVEQHLARCPRTSEALASIPRLDVPGAGPTAFFSLLQPRTSIPAHTGVTNARLITHLPLVVPPSCRFRVGSDTRPWAEGTAWVFDDTIEHEAWNDSHQERAVLIFDVWNPFLTEAERKLFRVASSAIREYTDDVLDRPRWDS